MSSRRREVRREHRSPEAGFSLVELLVAAVILGVGLMAIAGLSAGVGELTRRSTVETEQTVAGLQVLEHMVTEPFGTYPRGAGAIADTTLTVSDRFYTVSRAVFPVTSRVDSLRVIVEGALGFGPDTFRTRKYDRLPPPTNP